MSRIRNLILILMVSSSLILACSKEDKYKAKAGKTNQKSLTTQDLGAHKDHKMVVHSDAALMPKTGNKSCPTCDTNEIGRNANDLPPPIQRKESQRVIIDL